ncbi:hypothetical protein BSL78_00505 [Apostichopus japonicus]|uniref:Core-binding (CB) domain-containing protein n=1 Tax=Stichopus japonicus TaxID=307972 RepID=A0A2G8LQR6_STIJA|nr:hypothetical protein BSL78_00505 [Apostichopus japonicus]
MWAATVGLTGRLPTHPSAQGSPTVSNVPVCRTGLPVQGAPVRPVHGPQSLHENSGSGSLLPQKERGHPVRVPRRLVGGRELSVRGRRQRTQNAPYPPRAGLDREREEVSTISNSDDPVPWSDTRLLRRGSPTLGRKDHCGQDDHATDLVTPRVTQNDVAPSPGTHGQSGRCSPTVQVTHATPTASPPEVRRPHRSGHDNTNPQVGGNHSTPPMVARPRQLESRGTFHNRATNDICNDRRFTHRMGGSLEQPHSLGNVVPNRKIIPHQYPGDDRSQESSGNLQRAHTGYNNHGLHGQHHSGGLHQPAGGTHSEKLCRLAWEVITAAEDSGTILRASHIAGKLNVMADALSRGHLDPNEWTLEQETCNRIFAIFGKPMIDLFATYTNSKLQTFCSRRFHPQAYHTDAMSLPWDHLEAYVFPPLCMVGQVLRKIRNSKGRFILIAPFWPRRPWFAEIPQLLMDVPASLPDKPHLLSQRQGTLSHPDIKGLQLVAWKLSGLPYDREVFQRQLPRWQPTLEGERPQRLTIPAWRKFEQWCRPRQILLTKISIAQTAEFLLSLFREGKQVSTIKNYRSAIAAIHQGFPDGSTLGNNLDIAQLIKGMANRRPRVRRLAPSWGLSAVLHALAGPPYEPMANASLAALTKKTLFLIRGSVSKKEELPTCPNDQTEPHQIRGPWGEDGSRPGLHCQEPGPDLLAGRHLHPGD